MTPARKTLALLALPGTALIAVLPLFLHPTLPRGDDLGEHVQFVQDFSAGLGEGVLYPRWLAHANLGYGAPAFIFYPPLATALVSGLHLIGIPLFTSFRLGFLILTLGAAVACAWLGARLAPHGPRAAAAALTGSIFVLLPYHAVDVFNRFALAETATLVLLPLLFLFLETPGRALVPLGALTFAGLCLAHLPTAYLTVLVAATWIVLRSPRSLPLLVLVLTLGAGVAAIYWLPAVVEADLVHSEWLVENPVYRYDAHYLFAPGRVDVRSDPIHGRIKEFIDLPTLPRVRIAVLVSLGLAGLAWGALLLRARRLQGPQPDLLTRYAVLAAAAFVGMTGVADPIWRHLPGLSSVAFPWRLTTFVTLAAAVLVGGLLTEAGRAFPRAAIAAALALGSFLAWLTFALAAQADWKIFTREHAQSRLVRLRVAGEMMPKGNPLMRGFAAREPAGAPVLRDASGSFQGTVRTMLEENHRRVYEVTAPESPGVALEVPTFDYPGWSARLDGAAVPHGVARLGILSLPVPPGTHRVEWEFVPTPLRRAASWISVVSLASLVFLTLGAGHPTMAQKQRA